jgi:hypothetical protein
VASYTLTFTGRLKGALGVTHTIIDTVEADTFVEAQLKLYDKYECVHVTHFAKET